MADNAKRESGRVPRVFLCHSSGDKPAVRELYQRLCAEGIDAWLDEEELLPGQDWQLEIPKAVRASDVVIVCLSKKSVTKTGYVQKEIKFALDVADEQPEGAIFLIPARLEECDVPDRLSRWQWVNLYEARGQERLMRALRALLQERLVQCVEEVLKPFEEWHRESALEQLIAQGESERLEFKSSMRYNRKAGRRDEEIEKEIARTMCAFMNTEGGTLIIGVDDSGTVLGLDDDFSTLGGAKTQDGFIRAFENITKDLFSSPVWPDYYAARFKEHRGKLLYVIEVQRSKKPAFCLFGGEREFYVRKQTTTQKLDVEATLEYVRDHFKD